MVTPVVADLYTSVGCNRTPHALDWANNNGLVCFGASHAIAIYDPKYADGHGKIVHTLHEHVGRVNCVRWITGDRCSPETEFVSGCTDESVIIWSANATETFSHTCKLRDCGASINAVDGLYWEHKKQIGTLVAAVGDNRLCVWFREGKQGADFKLIKKLNTGSVLLLDCRIQLLPAGKCSVPLIACAGSDNNIHLFNVQSALDDGVDLDCIHTMKVAGHEDWIRTLSFTVDDGGDLLLASAAQDSLIRVWRLGCDNGDDSSSSLQSTQGKFSVLFEDKKIMFKCGLETVLQGHENWVYGLDWQPHIKLDDGSWSNPLRLLSCSMDKTMIVWGVDSASGVWLDQVRVGEVGGNTLGLYGCRFGQQGTAILAHGYQGALHLWHDVQGEWKPGVVCGGHFGPVEDLIWDPSGQFVITVSQDQTSRLHAPWVQQSNEQVTWHELSRPQVHGYDMSCIASLGPFQFASGAEEKVIRVFHAPQNFFENYGRICQQTRDQSQVELLEKAPQGASVPALGLSNKPVYQVEDQNKDKTAAAVSKTGVSDQYVENYFTPTLLDAPPTEETLLQNTLWPEVHKLYGHGYELFSMAANPEGTLLVSASRAQQTEHASILMWSTRDDHRQIGRLAGHTLTVTQMAFSPDGRKLVSVSRDRTWAVHEKRTSDETEGDSRSSGAAVWLETVARGSGGQRILWSCDWSPDSHYFVTGSRDKRVIVWEPDESQSSYRISGEPFECGESVTAVAFAPVLLSEGVYLIAIGQDSGHISLHSWNSLPAENSPQWTLIANLNQSQAHHLTVNRLKFRPVTGTAGRSTDDRIIQLASAGADNTFKIFNIRLP